MTAAFIVVVALALIPQVLFSFLYWKWIPNWVNNPYGRLAQLDAWCRIVFYFPVLYFTIFGRGNLSRDQVVLILTLCLLPVIFLGFLQLYLLRKAIDESTEEKARMEVQTMNPNPLVDLIPAAARKYVYGILTLLVFLYGVWQTVDGDWLQVVVSFVTSLVTGMATANTNVKADAKGDYATVPTVEDRVGAGENLDQTGVLAEDYPVDGQAEEVR